MRTPGSPTELAHLRLLAVERVAEGYSTGEVAEFLGIDPSSVRHWPAAFHQHGASGVDEADGRLDLELLPVEQLWTWLKYDRLCNFAPENAHQLDEVTRQGLEAVRDDQQRLRNFFHTSDLPLPRALLS